MTQSPPTTAGELLTRLLKFYDAAVERWADDQNFDGYEIQEVSLSLGLLVETEFDENVHTDEHGVGARNGDQWFVVAPDVLAALRQSGGDQ